MTNHAISCEIMHYYYFFQNLTATTKEIIVKNGHEVLVDIIVPNWCFSHYKSFVLGKKYIIKQLACQLWWSHINII